MTATKPEDLLKTIPDQYYNDDKSYVEGRIAEIFKDLNKTNLEILSKVLEQTEDGINQETPINDMRFGSLMHNITIKPIQQTISIKHNAKMYCIVNYIASLENLNPKRIKIYLDNKEISKNSEIEQDMTISYKYPDTTSKKGINKLPSISKYISSKKEYINKLLNILYSKDDKSMDAYNILKWLPTVEKEITAIQSLKSFEQLFPSNNFPLCNYRLNHIANLILTSPLDAMKLISNDIDINIAKLAFDSEFSKNENSFLLVLDVFTKLLDYLIPGKHIIQSNIVNFCKLLYNFRESEQITVKMLNIIKLTRPENLEIQDEFNKYFEYELKQDRSEIQNLIIEICNEGIINSYIDIMVNVMNQYLSTENCLFFKLFEEFSCLCEDHGFIISALASKYKNMINQLKSGSIVYNKNYDDCLLCSLNNFELEEQPTELLDFIMKEVLFSDLRLEIYPFSKNLYKLMLTLVPDSLDSRYNDMMSDCPKSKLEKLKEDKGFCQIMGIKSQRSKNTSTTHSPQPPSREPSTPSPRSVKSSANSSNSPQNASSAHSSNSRRNASSAHSSNSESENNGTKLAQDYYNTIRSPGKDLVTQIEQLEIDQFRVFCSTLDDLFFKDFKQELTTQYEWLIDMYTKHQDKESQGSIVILFELILSNVEKPEELFDTMINMLDKIKKEAEKSNNSTVAPFFSHVSKLFALKSKNENLWAKFSEKFSILVEYITPSSVFLIELTKALQNIAIIRKVIDDKKYKLLCNKYVNLYEKIDHDVNKIIANLLITTVPKEYAQFFAKSDYFSLLCSNLDNQTYGESVLLFIRNNQNVQYDTKIIINGKSLKDLSEYFLEISIILMQNTANNYFDMIYSKKVYVSVLDNILNSLKENPIKKSKLKAQFRFLITFNVEIMKKDDKALPDDYLHNPKLQDIFQYVMNIDDLLEPFLELTKSFIPISYECIESASLISYKLSNLDMRSVLTDKCLERLIKLYSQYKVSNAKSKLYSLMKLEVDILNNSLNDQILILTENITRIAKFFFITMKGKNSSPFTEIRDYISPKIDKWKINITNHLIYYVENNETTMINCIADFLDKTKIKIEVPKDTYRSITNGDLKKHLIKPK